MADTRGGEGGEGGDRPPIFSELKVCNAVPEKQQ